MAGLTLVSGQPADFVAYAAPSARKRKYPQLPGASAKRLLSFIIRPTPIKLSSKIPTPAGIEHAKVTLSQSFPILMTPISFTIRVPSGHLPLFLYFENAEGSTSVSNAWGLRMTEPSRMLFPLVFTRVPTCSHCLNPLGRCASHPLQSPH